MSPSLPKLPPPPGASFRFFPSKAKVFGQADFKIKLAGAGGIRAVRLFIDGAGQGTQMGALDGGVYHQELDTSFFADGTHEIGAAALDAQGASKITAFTQVDFHNVDQVDVVNLQQTPDRAALIINLVVRSLRAPLPREGLTIVDASAEGKETLATELVFAGGLASGGVPIATVQAMRVNKARFAPGRHQVTVAVSDLQGRPRTQTMVVTIVP